MPGRQEVEGRGATAHVGGGVVRDFVIGKGDEEASKVGSRGGILCAAGPAGRDEDTCLPARPLARLCPLAEARGPSSVGRRPRPALPRATH